jgi:hypothetical protein
MVVVGLPSAGSCVVVAEPVIEPDAAADVTAAMEARFALDPAAALLEPDESDGEHPERHPSPQCSGVLPHQPYCEQQVPW